MVRPTPEEVRNYAFSIGFNLNGEHFCDYYESKGWMIGKNAMKNWQAAVRTWKHNSPPSAMVGSKYDPVKIENRQRELDELREKEWQRKTRPSYGTGGGGEKKA